MNILNGIDKSKATRLAVDSSLVGLAAGLAYLLGHLSPEVFGTLAAPLAVAITLGLGVLKKYLPADASIETPSVGLQEARALAYLERIDKQLSISEKAKAEKLEEQAGKIVEAVGKHLEAR